MGEKQAGASRRLLGDRLIVGGVPIRSVPHIIGAHCLIALSLESRQIECHAHTTRWVVLWKRRVVGIQRCYCSRVIANTSNKTILGLELQALKGLQKVAAPLPLPHVKVGLFQRMAVS
jgi:hypothetical protein